MITYKAESNGGIGWMVVRYEPRQRDHIVSTGWNERRAKEIAIELNRQEARK